MIRVEGPIEEAGFFVAGGTLPLQSGSYIERAADKQILQSLLEGRFCYVLNSRQMGKSSLCVRTMDRLTEQGVRCAFIDITKIGGRNVTPEQWYAGLAVEVGRSLEVRGDILEYWKAEAHVSPMQKFFGALREVVLAKIPGKVVIFIDEIDSTRSLPFSADEFFAGVRECFNRRVQDGEFERLTFCFLGVAVPSDLIHDARTTPFNIGDRIYLRDFSLEEVMPLAAHLGPNGESVIRRVHYWTNGHPFLTQSVCRALAQDPSPTEAAVDALIQRDLLEPKVRETNINLSDVGNRVLNGYADDDDVEQYRADILSAYEKALFGKSALQDDESNRITAVLKLSGLMRSEAGQLKVRNRIYERAFDRAWIRENMPGQELRRQRIAYYKGVIRTTAIAAAVVAAIGYLAISNYKLKVAAEKTAREMAWRAYIADMNRLPVVFDQSNVPLMERLLDQHRNDEWRGPEWDYWDGRINDARWKGPKRIGQGGHDFFPKEDRVLWMDGNTATILETKTGNVLEQFEMPPMGRNSVAVLWDGNTIVRSGPLGVGYLFDLKQKKIIRRVPDGMQLYTWRSNYSRDGRYGVARTALENGVIDLKTMQFVLPTKVQDSYYYFGFLQDGTTVVRCKQIGSALTIQWVEVATKRVVHQMEGMENAWNAAMPNENWLTVTFTDGWLRRFRLSDGKMMWEIRLGDNTIDNASESKDGMVIGAATRSRSGYLVRVENGVPRLVRQFVDASDITVSEDGKWVYPSYRQMRAYDTTTAGTVVDWQLPNFLGAMSYFRATNDVLTATTEEVSLRKFENGEFKSPYATSREATNSKVRSGDAGAPRALLYDGNRFSVFDLVTKKVLVSFAGAPGQESMMTLSPDRILFSNNGKDFETIDVKTTNRRPGFKLEVASNSMTMTRDKRLIAVGGSEGSVMVLDAVSLKSLWKVEGHTQGVQGVRFSEDGSLLVTSSHDDTAKVWDVRSGKQICHLVGHAQSVISSDFLPGNTRVVTTSDDKTVRLWDVATGTELTTIGLIGEFPQFCSISQDKKYILAGNQSGLLRAWPLSKAATAR